MHHLRRVSCADHRMGTRLSSDEAIAELRARLCEEDVPGSIPVILTVVLEGDGRELRFVDILTSTRVGSVGPVRVNAAGYAEFESSDGVCYTVPGVLYWYSEAM